MKRDELRVLRAAASGRIPPTHFVVVGRELGRGLDEIETVYPGIMQPGDTAEGMLEGRRVLVRAVRDGRRATAWNIEADNATDEQLASARASARDVITIARPEACRGIESGEAGSSRSRGAALRARGAFALAPAPAQEPTSPEAAREPSGRASRSSSGRE